MKMSCVLAMLFGTCAVASAQTGATGTWRVDGAQPPFPWEVVLRVQGPRLIGMVNSCTSPYEVDIDEGRVDGNTITFTCKSGAGGDRDRTITFTGRINGDEIAFTWEMKVRDGGFPPNAFNSRIFGPSASHQFIAKRVPDGQLAEQNDKAVRGTEFAAAVNVLEQDVKVDGLLFLPQKVSRVRAVLIAPLWGLGSDFYRDSQVRRLLETTQSGVVLARFSNIGPNTTHGRDMFSRGAADSLLLLLQRLAQESRHPELTYAPLLFWGHSAAGSFGPTFAMAYPQRTIALVLYHSAGGGGGMAPGTAPVRPALNKIPALVFDEGESARQPIDPTKDFWMSGRSAGAPWTFAVEPKAVHGDPKDMAKANALLIPWISAVLQQRLTSDSKNLRSVTDGSAWLGNNQTGAGAPYANFSGSKADASWLPDQATARGWQVVLGLEEAR